MKWFENKIKNVINENNRLIKEEIVAREGKVRKDISQVVIDSGTKFFEKIDSIFLDINNLEERIKFLEELKGRLDDGIILMTKQQLLKLIEQKIEVFEGNISNKMSGLMVYVNDKTAGNGKFRDIDLLKKLARLEGIKDGIENRRTTEEIINKRDEMIKAQINGVDNNAVINALNWTLGENSYATK